MDVTCIIPVRNGAETIERAVTSAFNAGCKCVHVFDDDSSDATLGILTDLYKRLDANLSFGCGGDGFRSGVNQARNAMVENVELGLVIPLDADDELLDISPFVEAWTPDVWVYGDYIECDGQYETVIKGAPAGSLARKNITGVTFLYSVNQWYKAGGYDPDFAYAEDYGFQCALVSQGIKPLYIPKPLYRRHLKPEGNTRTVLAGHYWGFYHSMARSKYPSVFQ